MSPIFESCACQTAGPRWLLLKLRREIRRELFRFVEGAAGFAFDRGEREIGFVEDADGHVELLFLDPGMGADGCLAARTENLQELTFGGDAGFGFGMVERTHSLNRILIDGAAFDGDGPLAGGGQESDGIQHERVQRLFLDVDAAKIGVEQAEAQQTGGSLGPTIPRRTGTATKTDTPVTEIPR